MKKIKSKDYHNYVIKNGKFIGAFEEMYHNIDDPWGQGSATDIQYDIMLYLISRYNICSSDGNVFDIGCGKGAFTARMGNLLVNAKLTAIDISQTAINRAVDAYSNVNNISFKTMDIKKDYNKIIEKYDLIVMSQLMWYILPKFKEIANKLISRLNKGGYFLLNQTFYKPEEQKYGKEIVSRVEDALGVILLNPLEIIEFNRFTNHNAVILFKK